MGNLKKYWFVIMVVFAVFMFIEPIYCALILGGVMVYASISGISFLRKIQRNGLHCEGKLIGFETDSEGDRVPLIEFKTSEGQVINGKPYVSSSSYISVIRLTKHKSHVPISVSHLPDQPEKFVITSKNGHNYFTLIIFVLMGVAFIVLGILQLSGVVHFL